jgi:hypothetical protein
MKNLTTAIYGKCTSETDLYAAIGGRLYKGEVPQSAQFPHVVYFVVSDMPEYPGGKTIEQVLVQFSIYSITSSSTEVEDILTYLQSLYDDCSLTITSNTLIFFIRGNLTCMREDIETTSGTKGAWHYSQEYDVRIVQS